MARGRTRQVLVERFDDGERRGRDPDQVVVEEPLEVRLDGNLVATTMRTPGHDFELAAGLCFTDGLLAGAPIVLCRYCSDCGSGVDTGFNVVTVETGGAAPVPTPRLGTTTSSCGLCGSTSIAELRDRLAPVELPTPFPLDVLATLPAALGEQQLFAATGGVHCAAAVDHAGAALVVREDIGRHNAVDKVVGRLLLDGGPPAPALALYVSGRASFEIVIKAWAAGLRPSPRSAHRRASRSRPRPPRASPSPASSATAG